MTPSPDPVGRFVAAASAPNDETLAALVETLADDATLIAPFGRGVGAAGFADVLRNPRLAGLLGAATWSAPVRDGSTATVDATLPSGARLARIVSTLTLDDDGRLADVVQEIVMARPPPPEPLVLTDEMREAVNGAMANGTPIVVAYVDGAGTPHLSLRGTTQAYRDDQLALWARDPNGGIVKAVPAHPSVALFYRDPTAGISYQFTGRARLDSTPEVRAAVYDGSPEAERNLDPRQRGVAILVDLDRVEGATPAGSVLLER